ncbi:MAG TPA: hypothetical protein VMU84_14220, partial [Thermoanaerobaculia bacterium]|nr:hypothetical protein [Thermoanaerobaculia bacterium]
GAVMSTVVISCNSDCDRQAMEAGSAWKRFQAVAGDKCGDEVPKRNRWQWKKKRLQPKKNR